MVYQWYIYCQLGDYISPIPPMKGTRFHSIEPFFFRMNFTTWTSQEARSTELIQDSGVIGADREITGVLNKING